MHPVTALRRHTAEGRARAVTGWLRLLRTYRELDARHGTRIRAELVVPTLVLLTVTIVGAGAAAAGYVGHAPVLHATAARSVSPTHHDAPGPAAPAPQPALAPPAPAPPVPLAVTPAATPTFPHGALPVGKGMWIWEPDQVEGGDVGAMVARATAVGLTHVYVRTGSSVDGFNGAPFLDAVLPAAHAAGIRVYGWDFPYFSDVQADVDRAVAAIQYTTPDGQRLDGFSPDIETAFEGVNLSAENAAAYGAALRAVVGPGYPLIATVPRPSELMQAIYPYGDVLASFDAVAPMVYWLNRQPDTDVAGALDYLAQFGKPVFPIGQAYDGGLEGGRPGPPTADEIQRFISTADAHGATGVSFWSWQHADQTVWDAIAAAPQFTLPSAPVADLDVGEIRAVQSLLGSLGFATPVTGQWDAATSAALLTFQHAWGVSQTGVIDAVTRRLLLHPLAPPLLAG